jgi:hypothetical protein
MGKLSKAYYACLAAATAHHASSKTYSGKLFRPHANFVKLMIDRLGCKTVLDYGCGKGSQYKWVSHGGEATVPFGQTIEQYWGMEVHKFDPAWPPFATPPTGTFDLVICTHTLGTIPVQDLDEIVQQLHAYANKGVFIAEKIGEAQKRVYDGVGVEMPHGWQREDWQELIARNLKPGVETVLATRVNGEHGTIVTREVVA